MSVKRWISTPLAGTVGVVAGMCLMVIPLRRLTSDTAVPTVQAAAPPVSAGQIPAVLRVRLLAPAPHFILKSADGKVVLELENLPAGETEHDAIIPFDLGKTALIFQVETSSSEMDTAVFLTVMPDGYEDQTRYAIGTGKIEELLHYEWLTH